MVKDPVEDRRSDYWISENLTPVTIGLIRRENYRRLLVSSGNQLKETMGTFTVEGKLPHFIDNKERELIECLDPLLKSILVTRFLQSFN